jgi:hypothetical protein
MKKQAVLSSLGLLLGGRLAGVAGSALARSNRSPLRNFYTRMARRGFEEGFKGFEKELLPNWRWPALTRLGPTSGLLDYDAARFLGRDAASKVNTFKSNFNLNNYSNAQILENLSKSSLSDMSKSLGLRPRDLVKHYRELPSDYQKIIKSKDSSGFSSPMFRHLSDSLNYKNDIGAPGWIENRVLPYLYGRSNNSNVFKKTVGLSALNAGTQDALFNAAVSGRPISGMLQGIATGMAESAPEAAALSAAAGGKLKTLTALKSNLINTGYQSAVNPNLGNRAITGTVGNIDSNMREFLQMGKDLANPGKNKVDKMLQSEAMKAIEHHGSPQNIREAIKEEFINPAVSRIKKYAPDMFKQLTYEYT